MPLAQWHLATQTQNFDQDEPEGIRDAHNYFEMNPMAIGVYLKGIHAEA